MLLDHDSLVHQAPCLVDDRRLASLLGGPALASSLMRAAAPPTLAVPRRPGAFQPVAGFDDRRSQKGFLAAFHDRCVRDSKRDFRAHMSTGAGKTACGISATRRSFDLHEDEANVPPELQCGASLAIIVVHTEAIRQEWIKEILKLMRLDAAADLHVAALSGEDWRRLGRKPATLPARTVLLVSPQALGHPAADDALRALVAHHRGKVLVVVDEVHHYSRRNAWGAAVKGATEGARTRVVLSGTPYRHDDGAILGVAPGAAFDAHYTYGKADALRDGVVARLTFELVDARLEALGPSGLPGGLIGARPVGQARPARAGDASSRLSASKEASRALRHAWRRGGSLTAEMVEKAVAALDAICRLTDGKVPPERRPGGAIACHDLAQMMWIKALLEALGQVVLTTSCHDDEPGSAVIERFNKGEGDWLLALRRLTEGLNVPRLRVGVYAGCVSTRQVVEQFAGRFERLLPGIAAADQGGLVFLPDVPDFRGYATEYEAEAKTIDQRRRLPVRACPGCAEAVPTSLTTCPHCRHQAGMEDAPTTDDDDEGQPAGSTQVPLVAHMDGSTIRRSARPFTPEEVRDLAARFDRHFPPGHAFHERARTLKPEAKAGIMPWHLPA